MEDAEKDNIDDLNLEELNRNINIKLDVFGEIELRHILNGDLPDFRKFLKNINDEKEFCAQIIYHQLVLPEIGFSKFNEISDEELKIVANQFLKFEFQIFKPFKEKDNTDFFTNFRLALKHYFKVEKVNDTTLTTLIESSIVNMSFELPNIHDLLYLEQYMDNIISIDQIANLNSRVANLTIQLINSLPNFSYIESLIKQYSLEDTFLESIISQTRSLGNWTELNSNIFDVYDDYWQDIGKLFENPEEKSINILSRYKWFLTPSLPQDFALKVLITYGAVDSTKSDIDKLFIDYFSLNNYENLEKLIENWADIDIFQPRMKIFRDCVSLLKIAKKDMNPSNMVIPTLISQIDGIQQTS